jgi:purine-binding chemotaxis protein CheW
MTNLARTSRDALAPAGASALYVVFRIGASEYALPSDIVTQLESFTTATAVPGAAAFVVGIVQVRGRVVPVIDLRVRFGLPPAPTTIDSRVVIGQIAERVVGLLVDSGREVVRLEPSMVQPPPPMVMEQSRGFVKSVAQIGPRLIMLLDFARVIGEEQVDVG